MTKTQLTALVKAQVSESATTTIARAIDRTAEKLADEILKEPGFREEMRALIRAAFKQTMQELTAPTDEDGTP